MIIKANKVGKDDKTKIVVPNCRTAVRLFIHHQELNLNSLIKVMRCDRTWQQSF